MTGIGLDKYDDFIADSILASEEYTTFFRFPRSLLKEAYKLSSFDIVVAATILSYGSGSHNGYVITSRLNEKFLGVCTLGVGSRKSDAVNESIGRLISTGLFYMEKFNNGSLIFRIDIRNGYFLFNYDDFYKMIDNSSKSSKQAMIHIYSLINSSAFPKEDDDSSWISYMAQTTMARNAGVSRYTVIRTMKVLEDEQLIATYKVALSGLTLNHKLVCTTYKNRDKLRRYVESQLGHGGMYSKIISNEKGDEDNGK